MAERKIGEGTDRGRKIIEILEISYPDAGITLDYSTPFELLVATILAAQCTDERVNRVTKDLFPKYTSPRHYFGLPVEELEEDIHSTGFFRNKARSLRNLSEILVNQFDGVVPDDLESLVSLPGVGRKTANVILGNAFGKSALAVDTHVRRVSTRLGLTRETDPDKIEFELMKIVPKRKWALSNHLLIFHGRKCCKARKPRCGKCPLFELCLFEEKTELSCRQTNG